MYKPANISVPDVEQLRDLTPSRPQDAEANALNSWSTGWSKPSQPTMPSSQHEYAKARSKSPSLGPVTSIPTRHDSYGLQRLVSLTRERLAGWKKGMLLALWADLAIMILTLALTLYAAFGFSKDRLQATLIDDNCGAVRNWSTWLHLGINILSTALLATSSYVMQCLASPTRKEIDRAHLKGKYMDVGVPSFRNLFHTTGHRLFLWAVLVLSSLPLHLLANSAVYETQGTNSYVLAVVEEEFISRPLSELANGRYAYVGAGFNSGFYVSPQPAYVKEIQVDLGWNTTKLLKDLVPQMERLENADCMRAYAQPLVSNRRNVIAVTSQKIAIAPNSSYNYVDQVYYQTVDFCPDCRSYQYFTDPTLWLCAWLNEDNPAGVRGCNVQTAISRASEWKISDEPIEYCLSERADGKCQLQANLAIMIIITICTLVKIGATVVAFRTLPTQIIATIGDAVASFLQAPELQTTQCSLLTRGDVQHRRWVQGAPFPKSWSSASFAQVWGSAPSAAHWASTIALLGALLITTIAFFGIGLARLKGLQVNAATSFGITVPTDVPSIMRMGFGVVNVNFLVTLPDMSSSKGVIGHTLLVNTPQLVLSFSYFAYNTIWTNMLIAREWAQFGRRRMGLRVSHPAGEQRGNYFLTIPYPYAVALLAVSAVLHWLLSQSFFLARVNVNAATPFVDIQPAVINTVGYSLGALLIFFIIASLAVVTLMAVGIFVRLRSPIPIVGGCSMAISAACHPHGASRDIALEKLKWGVLPSLHGVEGLTEDDQEWKHCAFSAGEVISPAGLPHVTIGRVCEIGTIAVDAKPGDPVTYA